MTPRGRLLLALTGVIVFLGIWEAVPRLSLVGPALLPPPSAIVPAFWREITSGEWFVAIYRSLIHYVIGLLIGSGMGIGLGVLTGMSARLEAALSWVVRLLRPIPGLAWVPFAILWFGISPAAATFIIAVGVFWINYFAALAAVQAVDRELIEVAEAFGYRSPGEAHQGDPAGVPAGHPQWAPHRHRASMDGGSRGGAVRGTGSGPADDASVEPARDRDRRRLHDHHRGPLRRYRQHLRHAP